MFAAKTEILSVRAHSDFPYGFILFATAARAKCFRLAIAFIIQAMALYTHE